MLPAAGRTAARWKFELGVTMEGENRQWRESEKGDNSTWDRGTD